MEHKTCRICNTSKPLTEYQFRNDSQKYRTECSECRKQFNKEYQKTYVKGGKPKSNDSDPTRECNMCHKVKPIEAFELRVDTGKRRGACIECKKAYHHDYITSEEYKAKVRTRTKEDSAYMIERRYRSRVQQVLSYAASDYKPTKLRKSMDFLGCSLQDFKKHIEGKFQSGMSWEDNSSFVLDHIIPCAWFDFNIPEHQDICFHYTNLQPLTSKQNVRKSDKIMLEYMTEDLWDRLPQELRDGLLSKDNRKKRTIRSQAS